MSRLPGELIPLYRQVHAKGGKRYKGGSTLRRYVDEIAHIVQDTDTITILDYGCGRGHQYFDDRMHERWGGIMPTLFDPGVAGLDELPAGEFDGVICTGVLEHIPRERIAGGIRQSRRLCTEVVFSSYRRRSGSQEIARWQECPRDRETARMVA